MGNTCSLLLCTPNKSNKIYPIQKKYNSKLKKYKKKTNYVIIPQEQINHIY